MRRSAPGPNRGDDKGIVTDHTNLELHLFRWKVDVHHIAHDRGHVLLVGQDTAQELGDFRYGQCSRGNLIEQRLKEVMIPPIHECDADGFVPQPLRTFETGKPAAEDENMFGDHQRWRG